MTIKQVRQVRYCSKCGRMSPTCVCERYRGTRTQRGYTKRWVRQAQIWRRIEPLCQMCLPAGRITPGQCVDHIIPHLGDQTLFWDRDNWQTLCHKCHSKKTIKERMRMASSATVVTGKHALEYVTANRSENDLVFSKSAINSALGTTCDELVHHFRRMVIGRIKAGLIDQRSWIVCDEHEAKELSESIGCEMIQTTTQGGC